MGLVNPMHALAQHHFGRHADCSLHLSQCLEFPEKEEAQLCQEGKGILLAVTPSVHCVSEGQWCCKSCVLQLPLPSCEQGTQPGKIVSVPLKSALTWVWLEKMASPFLLGMVFTEHSIQCMNLWLQTESSFCFFQVG